MIRNNTRSFNSFTYKLIAFAGLLLLLGFIPTSAGASDQTFAPDPSYTSIAAAPNGGFWVQLHDMKDFEWDFRTIAIDGAPQFESINAFGSITSIPGKNGYWMVRPSGDIYARGEAPELCSGRLQNCSGFSTDPAQRITAAAASPNGKGLWAVDNNGHVWTAGEVVSYGDVSRDGSVPTGIVPTPSGKGYYIVCEDGGVHGRGDAVLFGSTGGNKPGGHNITGIALSYNLFGEVNGYWLVGSDGGVHSFGNAPFLGSTGGGPGRHAVSSIVARPDGRSYAWVYRDGRVESVAAQPVVIQSVTEGKVIDVPNASTEQAPLQLAGANDSASQKWKLLPFNGAFKIVNVNSSLCMDLEYGAESGRVIQYPCKQEPNPTNQLWKLVKDQSGAAQFYALEQSDYRLYGYPDEYGAGLIVSYYTNNGLSWTVTPVQ